MSIIHNPSFIILNNVQRYTLKERWEQLVQILSDQFSQGEDLDLDAIIYLMCARISSTPRI
jgi:hypothetical protein